MLNMFVLEGRPTRDIDLNDKGNFCKFTLACPQSYINKNGNRGVDFFSMVAFNKNAQYLANNAHKGSTLVLHGVARNNNYEDNNGKTVHGMQYVIESPISIPHPKDIFDAHIKSQKGVHISRRNQNEALSQRVNDDLRPMKDTLSKYGNNR